MHTFEAISADFPDACAHCNLAPQAHLVTSTQLTEEMLRWVHGEKSHWNEFASLTTLERAEAIAQCATADAQEVVKLSAAIQALVVMESARSREMAQMNTLPENTVMQGRSGIFARTKAYDEEDPF